MPQGDPLINIHVYFYQHAKPRVCFARERSSRNYRATLDQLVALAHYVNTRCEWAAKVYGNGWTAKRAGYP
jgi:hypothetical protein